MSQKLKQQTITTKNGPVKIEELSNGFSEDEPSDDDDDDKDSEPLSCLSIIESENQCQTTKNASTINGSMRGQAEKQTGAKVKTS